ncbi:MAG TPA: MauE/DoxX family redox-associated membrane protein [Actinomycetes bacterium]|nr:MauE/DoxX family redox-associated membrane protein [Actinomycetes bacterium]
MVHEPATPAAIDRRRFVGSSLQLWISTVVRVGLGGVLVVAGGLKIADPQQAALAVQAYQILPTQVAEYVGYGLPLVELGLGVLLILGLGTRLAAIGAGALMTAFVVGVISAWARGLSIDCGCFGGGGAVPKGEASYLPVILRDAGFAAMAAWLVALPASRLALDRGGRVGTGDLGLYDEFPDIDEDAMAAQLDPPTDAGPRSDDEEGAPR